MKYISHRGNLDSIDLSKENTPNYIDEALSFGYDVELDVHLVGKEIYLGHDGPENLITLSWLLERKDYIWVHTKNFSALNFLIDKDLRIFYHFQEKHTIINNCNIIWSHNLNEINNKSIIPLIGKSDLISFYEKDFSNVYGVCSDYILLLRQNRKEEIYK